MLSKHIERAEIAVKCFYMHTETFSFWLGLLMRVFVIHYLLYWRQWRRETPMCSTYVQHMFNIHCNFCNVVIFISAKRINLRFSLSFIFFFMFINTYVKHKKMSNICLETFIQYMFNICLTYVLLFTYV